MADKSSKAFDELLVSGATTLCVGWKTSDSYGLGHVGISNEIAVHLRSVAAHTVEKLAARDKKDYSPDAHLYPEEYLFVPIDALGEEAAAWLDELRKASALPNLHASDLPSRPLHFYAAAIGDDPKKRTIFIRKTNPHKSVKTGNVFATLGNTLKKLADPVFLLDNSFDMVATGTHLYVLNQHSFAILFRGAPSLAQRYEPWVDEIAVHLPFADGDAKALSEAAKTDSRLWGRLLSIHERGHLKKVTIEDLRAEAKRQDLDPATLFDGDRLVFDGSDHFTLLKLLNEDLFTGALSGEHFEVDRKSPRG